jgi:two-component system, OmpR family, sensor histidine kinase CiaH
MAMGPDAALFRRLRRRLALVIALVIAAILALLVGGVILLMDQVLINQQADALRAAALAARDELRFDASGVRLRTDPDEAGTVFLVWGPSGDLVASTDATSASAFSPDAQAAMGGTGSVSQVELPGTHGSTAFLVASEPIRTLSFVGVIQAARSLAPIRAAEGQVIILLLLAAGAGVILAGAAGWYLAGRSLRPAQAAFRRQREFTADASHELRTPLAVIDAGLQVLTRHPEQPLASQAPTLSAMRTQTSRMTQLVADLLTLAGADAGQAALAIGPVDLDALVEETVAAFQPLAADRGASVRSARHEGGVVGGDRQRLGQALGTLVHNALEHGGPGVHIELSAWRDGHRAFLEVRDDGPGIAPEDRERVLERFSRGDLARSRGGSGLGLAIARWVAAAHDGRLDLDVAVPGAERPGLRARIELPLGSVHHPSV